MGGHRLVRKPRSFKGKVRGGLVVGCECGWLVVVPGDFRAAARAHQEHLDAVRTESAVVEAKGGPWTSPETWVGGAVPTAEDHVSLAG